MNQQAGKAEMETFTGRRAGTGAVQNPCKKQQTSLERSYAAWILPAHAQEVIEVRQETMTVAHVRGDVRLQPHGQPERAAVVGDVLCEGDELFAGYESEAMLTSKETTLTVRANTQIRLATLQEKKFHIRLEKGELRTQIKVSGPTRPDVRIQTPTATASARGTDFVVRLHEDTSTEVWVTQGTVAVAHEDGSQGVVVHEGQKTIATATTIQAPLPFEPPSSFPLALVTLGALLIVVFIGGAWALQARRAH